MSDLIELAKRQLKTHGNVSFDVAEKLIAALSNQASIVDKQELVWFNVDEGKSIGWESKEAAQQKCDEAFDRDGRRMNPVPFLPVAEQHKGEGE